MFLQKTLRGKATVDGIGLHSGLNTSISFCPAPPDTGIHLIRTDLEGCPSVLIHAHSVTATSLATTIGCEHFRVATVEHCLSSLAAFRIDNVYLELKGSEIPIGDGSAQVFHDEILRVGTVEQGVPRKYLYIKEPIHVGNEEKHAYVLPYNGLRITCTIDFPHPVIGEQKLDVDVCETTFSKELVSARTFGFLKDVEKMQAMGLALGGSLDNAIVLSEEGVMNPSGLRFEDEFVRHKTLDAIGDLVTLGRPLMGHLVLYKAGHDLMNQLVKKILACPDATSDFEVGESLGPGTDHKIPFS